MGDAHKWEAVLPEGIRKDYEKYEEATQSIVEDIMIFMRCELVARTFS